MNQNSNNQAKGFTLIELMVAMAFVAMLLLAIAATVMQIGAIYNKGVTMKSVNQAGRLVVADMKRTIGGSELFVVPKADDAAYGQASPLILQSATGGIIAPGDDDPHGGRLCTGTYTYIWNVGRHIDPNDPTSQANQYEGSDSSKQLRLVRMRDNGGQKCKDVANSHIQFSDATELLSDGNLAVQDFHIEDVTDNVASGLTLYSVSIVISNADQDEIQTVDNTCKPPSETGSYQNYCAVNEFIFTAQAGNKEG
jgi:prepilin-type N-terminal cleavage/methylation domain-containing protein